MGYQEGQSSLHTCVTPFPFVCRVVPKHELGLVRYGLTQKSKDKQNQSHYVLCRPIVANPGINSRIDNYHW
ncbi:hypothetical protein DPMN_021119 [Dreissena polymorpha]|uniref:Uncharacterized protein n=1 Tax=Dreissena polymorpha TaxID=45954 RepID=A0A9D4NM81_DREPO|nr:hypothetical protein DPMN_021119 [Dreissena polymorpha]